MPPVSWPWNTTEDRIEKAIKALDRLLEKYDRNREITDIDIAHVIEILKGRE